MLKILNNPIYLLAMSTPVFMLANMVGGALIAGTKDKFEIEILKASLIKYVGLLFMVVLLYTGAYLSEQAISDILDIQLNIKELVLLGIATFAASYAIQSIIKFKELAGIKIERED